MTTDEIHSLVDAALQNSPPAQSRSITANILRTLLKQIAGDLISQQNNRLRRVPFNLGLTGVDDDEVQFQGATWIKEAGTIAPGQAGYGGVLLPGKAGFRYRRKKDYISVLDFADRVVGSNWTMALQAALDAAKDNPLKRTNVYCPAQQYLIDQVVIPTGVNLFGDGALERGDRASTKFIQNSAVDVIRIDGDIDTSSGRAYWFGKLYNFSIMGKPSAGSGYGISFRRADGTTVTPQDLTHIHNIIIRATPSGGIEFPDGALPLTVDTVKFLWCNGPGIDFAVTGANKFQSCLFSGVSGDGNNGGLIRFKNLDAQGSITILNLKSEQRVNSHYGNVGMQNNPIVFDNCAGTPVTILGASHICSWVYSSNPVVNNKPGSLIKVLGVGQPKISWKGVSIRVRATDTPTDPDPMIIDGQDIPYTVSEGKYGDFTSGHWSGTKLGVIFGKVARWLGRSILNETHVVQVNGEVPAFSLFSTDSPANQQHWLDVVSGGVRSKRLVKDDRNFTLYERDVADANGLVIRKQFDLGEIRHTDAAPKQTISNTSAATDEKNWRWVANAQELILQLFNDAYAAGVSGLGLRRNGTTPDGVTLRQRLILTGSGGSLSSLNVSAANGDARPASLFTVSAASAQNLTFLGSGTVGQLVILHFTDSNTTLVHSTAGATGSLNLAGGRNWNPKAGDCIIFYRNGTTWEEVTRSAAAYTYVQAAGAPTVNASRVGEEYFDPSAKIWYKAVQTGTGATDWKPITN
ncbi:hypothetical protein LX87_05196 [Larkinella arboricola]|uniref:Pectate lyase-like protein n=1 Tax=Larkinella arboricola TaxID=643671 RepID=A0A327WN19_LARAB|nr:hypothetical protein [Larkinella arboricola]RAJ92228.1 hypothetical protein LX87_05196 [Larkinella arboricola]